MVRRRAGASSFDECDRCGGLWLSPDTLAAINTQAETRADLRPFDQPSAARSGSRQKGAAAASYRRCPQCRKHMNRDSFATGSGVVLDICRQHGCFLDNGELTRLLGFIESGGLEKARQRDAESLKAEIGDLKRRKVLAGAGPTDMPVQWDAGGSPGIDLVRWIAEAFLRRG